MWISKIELDALLGKDGAFALSSALGGDRIYVPMAPDSTHPLAAIIGLDGMAALCAACGGVGLSIPKTARKLLKEKILELLRCGKAHREVARECGATLRYVQRVASAKKNKTLGVHFNTLQ